MTEPDPRASHQPYTNDGEVWCGWPPIDLLGCGEPWPCEFVRSNPREGEFDA